MSIYGGYDPITFLRNIAAQETEIVGTGDGPYPRPAVSHNNLAYMLWRTGQYALAENTFREMLALQRRQYTDDHTTTAIMLNC